MVMFEASHLPPVLPLSSAPSGISQHDVGCEHCNCEHWCEQNGYMTGRRTVKLEEDVKGEQSQYNQYTDFIGVLISP